MKKITFPLLLVILIGLVQKSNGQNNDDVLNLLINKNIISRQEADSIRAEAAIKAQDQKEKQKQFTITTRRPIQISGYTQVRFQSFQEAGKADGTDIRRARLDFKGNVTPTWEYRLQVEMASSPKIIDAYSVFKPFDYLKIQAGQFKIPFSLENLTTSSNLETIERAQVVEALVARGKDVIGNNNGRDIGIQIFGSALKIHNGYLVDYFAGVFNGAGINTTETNEIKDFVGRLLLHPLSGLCIGGSCYIGYDKIGTSNQVRNRYGCELSYDYKIISIKGEYITGQDGNIKRSGYYAQASCFVLPKKVQLVTRYDVFDNNLKTEKDITTNVLSGLNFFFNDWAKIQVNCTLRYEEGTTINNDIIGAQLQVSF